MSDLGNNKQPKTQQEAGTPAASASTSAHAVLALPAPPSKEQTKNVQKIDLGDSEGNGGTTFKFDELGPLVVSPSTLVVSVWLPRFKWVPCEGFMPDCPTSS